jgi:type II secretory pathway pseudopilin PulG
MDLHKILLGAHRGFAYLELLLVAIFIIALLVALLGQSGKISKRT